MNRNILLSAACVAVVLTGCSDRTLKSVHTHEFNESVALADGRPDSISISMVVECPEKGATEQALKEIRTTIKTAVLGDDYTVLNFDDGFRALADSLVENYKNTNTDILGYFGKDEPSMSLSWEYIVSGNFTGNYRNYSTYTVEKYSYTGGAHGMPYTENYVFDLRDGHQVEESEIFTEDYKPLLSQLLTAHSKDNAEDPENMTFFVSEIEPNGNFGLSAEGVTYIYNPYEIAPYSSGTIRITVPWKELKDIVK